MLITILSVGVGELRQRMESFVHTLHTGHAMILTLFYFERMGYVDYFYSVLTMMIGCRLQSDKVAE